MTHNTATNIQSLWNKIQKKLQEIAPETANGLLGGVSDAQIKAFEEKLNIELPDDFIACYKLINGQDDTTPWMVDGEVLLSLERIADEWQVWKDLLDSKTFEDSDEPYQSDPDKGVKNCWWNEKWIPFTYDGAGNHLCIDLDPDTDGNYGQIIRMWHDDYIRPLHEKSFTDWLSNYASQLQSGDLLYSEEYQLILNKEEVENG